MTPNEELSFRSALSFSPHPLSLGLSSQTTRQFDRIPATLTHRMIEESSREEELQSVERLAIRFDPAGEHRIGGDDMRVDEGCCESDRLNVGRSVEVE